jgi:hypothetical protein
VQLFSCPSPSPFPPQPSRRTCRAYTAEFVRSDPPNPTSHHPLVVCGRYGILYGMGVRELAAALERPVHAAVALQEQFRQRFAGLAKFTESVRRTCREAGYVETLFGRRRYLPLIRSEKVMERSEAERVAVNSTFQVGLCGCGM